LASHEVNLKLYKADSIDVRVGAPGTQSDFLDISDVAGAIKRQGRIFAIFLLTSLCIGGAFLTLAQPFYSSDVIIILDRDGDLPDERRSQSDIAWAKLDPMRNDPYILTQIQLLTSNGVLDRAIDRLGLMKDPEFLGSQKSFVSPGPAVQAFLPNWLFGKRASEEARTVETTESSRERVRAALLSSLSVVRIGDTDGLRIRYVSISPDMSARIVNAISDAYSTDLLNARYDGTRKAGNWLQEKIGELQKQAFDSDLAVQTFRTQHNLLTTTDKETEEDVLISSQQLEDLNKALSAARTDVTFTRARYEQIKRIVDSGQIDSEVSGTVRNYLSNDLRIAFLEAVRLEADLARRLGPNHAQAVRQRVTVESYRKLMFEELQRVAETYLSEATEAESRLANIEKRAQAGTALTTVASEDQVQMRELERNAETYRRLYEAFLMSYQETIQQQNIPVSRSRVVSNGRPADAPNYPSRSLIMALFFLIGMVGGGSLAAFRESREKFFRTGADVEDKLALAYLGAVPRLVEAKPEQGQDPSFERRRRGSELDSYVIGHPFSNFAETLRSTKIAIDMSMATSRARVVGIVSTAPGEGKSTIAINLARFLADTGKRVILIDGDLRHPGATRRLAPQAATGVMEVLVGGRDWKNTLVQDPLTAMTFLPAVVPSRISHSADLLSSTRMSALLDAMKSEMDYIIIDLPPIGPVVDARAMSHLVDRFVYTIEWGGISQKAVLQAVAGARVVNEKCVGVILTKVDPERVALYRHPDLIK
jgi:succinoglycan biosynthesis transport protein ExoP